MKRILSLLIILALVFSFASCKGKNGDDSTNAATPVIEESTHSKEFRDESGRVVFTVDVTVPEITDKCDPKIAEYINGVALDIFNDACGFAESNLESAAKSASPWSKKITFETTLLNNRYACFLISDFFSLHGDTPILSTVCFDVQKGTVCTLNDFACIPDEPEACFESFLYDILARVLPVRFHNPEYITEDVLQKLDEIVDPSCFYLTEKGMGFYFNKNLVHYYLNGNYKVTFSWDELTGCYQLPE